MKWFVFILVGSLLVGCSNLSSPTPVTRPLPVVSTTKALPTVSPYPTPTRAPSLTPLPDATAYTIPTPNEFASYTIAALRLRSYGSGQVQDLGIIGQTDSFLRHSISYPSDGWKIHGFMNVPLERRKFPVIIAIHGYSDPAVYETLDYTTDAADGLAALNYIVVHPNLRNFPPSDNGDAMFRVGYAIDVLNLIALIKQSAGQPGLFEQADGENIGIWSHSMGGDIALRVAVVSHDVKAILLYSPLSGDEQKNSNFFRQLIDGSEIQKELSASSQDFAAISPSTYYMDIKAAVQIHHGTADTVIPVTWSQETCQELTDAVVDVKCYYYEGADHTFRSRFIEQFNSRMDDFFAKYLGQ